jgi:D-aspartate ligase
MAFEILIIGSDVNAYYMARCTHEAYKKKSYMLIKDKLAYTTYSKIINHIYNDKIWDEGEFVKAVNKFADEHQDKKIVVISSNETYAQFLVKNKPKFKDNILFNYPNLEIFDSLINKELFYKTYASSELSFPKTLYVKPSDFNETLIDFMFPIIIKPANVVMYNHVDFKGKKKIYKVSDEQELLETINTIKNSDYTDTLIIQEFIPGDDSHLFDSVVYSDKNGDVKLVSFAQIGLQEHNPNMVGNAAVVINGYNSFKIDTTSIVEDIKNFMNSISYCGFAEFDMKYDERDGKFKVLEINARQGRCSYYIVPLGYNLVEIMVNDLVFNKEMKFHYINKKSMLSFVNKSIIKKYIVNNDFKREALLLYRKSVNPLKYRKDFSIYRTLLYIKRSKNYKNSYKSYEW